MPQWLTIAQMVLSIVPLIQGSIVAPDKTQTLALLKSIMTATVTWTKLDQPSMDAILTIVGELFDMGLFGKKAA